MYAYNEAVVTARSGYVSGILRSPGKDAGVSMGQAIHIGGGSPASYAVWQQVRPGSSQSKWPRQQSFLANPSTWMRMHACLYCCGPLKWSLAEDSQDVHQGTWLPPLFQQIHPHHDLHTHLAVHLCTSVAAVP